MAIINGNIVSHCWSRTASWGCCRTTPATTMASTRVPAGPGAAGAQPASQPAGAGGVEGPHENLPPAVEECSEAAGHGQVGPAALPCFALTPTMPCLCLTLYAYCTALHDTARPTQSIKIKGQYRSGGQPVPKGRVSYGGISPSCCAVCAAAAAHACTVCPPASPPSPQANRR